MSSGGHPLCARPPNQSRFLRWVSLGLCRGTQHPPALRLTRLCGRLLMAGRKRSGLSTIKSFKSPCRGSPKPARAPGEGQRMGLGLTEPQAGRSWGTRVGVPGEATVTAQSRVVGRRRGREPVPRRRRLRDPLTSGWAVGGLASPSRGRVLGDHRERV